MKRLGILAVLVLATLEGAGATNHRTVDNRGVLKAIAQAPAKSRDWKNPYDGNPDAIVAGEKLFRRHCAECHGDDALGRGRAANLRSPTVQNATPGELAWFLRNGSLARGMPSWSGIPEQRRWQIVSYLKSLRS